jgi:ABC-type antimicrobial peptide transport system permease subunit
MYTLFEMILIVLASVILGVASGYYIGWNMCKTKMDTDRYLERLKEKEERNG